jgi:hypothetical protein
MNLVVVGAHQEGIASRMLFGPVSVSVVEHATSPVAVVPMAAADLSEEARRGAALTAGTSPA